jgi:hypothetical protein
MTEEPDAIELLVMRLKRLEDKVAAQEHHIGTLQQIALRLTGQDEKNQTDFMKFLTLLTGQPAEIQEAIREQAKVEVAKPVSMRPQFLKELYG